MTAISDAKFIDFGASSGGSIQKARDTFGGVGRGLDIDPEKIKKLKERGFDGIVSDVSKIALEPDSVNYVTMMNFLEHLPNREFGEKAIDNAVRIASDFVFMLGPNFDHNGYLRKLGLRKFFSAWTGHTWEHQVSELSEIISKHGKYRCLLIESERIYDSYNSVIIPNTTPKNSGQFDPKVHAEKPFVVLNDARVYGWVAFAVVKNPQLTPEQILMRGLYLRDVRPISSLPKIY